MQGQFASSTRPRWPENEMVCFAGRGVLSRERPGPGDKAQEVKKDGHAVPCMDGV